MRTRFPSKLYNFIPSTRHARAAGAALFVGAAGALTLGVTVAAGSLTLAGCGGSKDGSGFENDQDGGAASGNNGNGGATDGGSTGNNFGSTEGGPSDTDASADDCPASATLVYVTGEGSKLYSFYPPTTSFTLIGTLSCLSSPTHMTVDRQGVAWVVSSGKIYKASTSDASCSEVSTWKSSLFGSFPDFALSFIGVSNTVDNTLYILNDSGKLATFDIAGGAVTTVGNMSLSSTQGDMTSNGDGTLYYLNDVMDPSVKLYEVSPKDASTVTTDTISAAGGGSQALAFWGGSFYAFENSTIYQYDPTMKTTKNIGKAPLSVTGAGQSTCVPKVPPPTK